MQLEKGISVSQKNKKERQAGMPTFGSNRRSRNEMLLPQSFVYYKENNISWTCIPSRQLTKADNSCHIAFTPPSAGRQLYTSLHTSLFSSLQLKNNEKKKKSRSVFGWFVFVHICFPFKCHPIKSSY